MKGASQMEISFISKNKAIQPQNIQEQKSDPAKNIDTEENKKYILKNKIDSAEISGSYSGLFEDKRITVAKSAILYEMTMDTSTTKIDELKKSIKNGSYHIPTSDIANKILGE